jgi:uncharacterized protein (TIGR00251 family)
VAVENARDDGSSSSSLRLAVKVVPGARRDQIAGWLGDALKLRVAAPPEQGRANAAVEALLTAALGLKRGQVRIVAGHGSPRKTVEIDGLDRSTLDARLARATRG